MPALSAAKGAECLRGGGGAPVPPLVPAPKPGGAGRVAGARSAPQGPAVRGFLPWHLGVCRAGQGRVAKPMGSGQGIDGCSALRVGLAPCGITSDVPAAQLGAAGGAEPKKGTALWGARGAQCQSLVGFGYQSMFGGFTCTESAQARARAQPPLRALASWAP